MKKILAIVFLLLYCLGWASAQDENYFYENAIYNENIKSVQLYREGFELSNPILDLYDEGALLLSFDDLSGELKDYNYTIVHCDANWNESYIMQDEYLEGFPDNPIDDYANSFNTTFKYINYQLLIPNEDVKIKMSGNYALLVFEGDNKENVVFTKRFYVKEPKVEIDGTVRRSTKDAFKGEHHEVDFSVFHPSFQIDNPVQDIKVVVMQNNRWDNAITNLKPLFIRDKELVYDYDKENVFKAGNEFRYFDIRNRRANTEGVLKIDFFRPYYHFTLWPDEIRSNKRFYSYEELNGEYVVESQELVDDYSVECDYVFVHFSLPLESILLGGTVNVFGALSNWNANKSNEMTWNFDTSTYELTLLLKQGYYNYQYVYVETGAKSANVKNLEGSFWETENDYQIFVYYRDIAGRYDRLIGYTTLNSKRD